MTVKEIEETLSMLRYMIEEKRFLMRDDGEIRVHIGRDLLELIIKYYDYTVMHYRDVTQHTTIYGYPVEIDYVNPMCLEVHIVYSVPI